MLNGTCNYCVYTFFFFFFFFNFFGLVIFETPRTGAFGSPFSIMCVFLSIPWRGHSTVLLRTLLLLLLLLLNLHLGIQRLVKKHPMRRYCWVGVCGGGRGARSRCGVSLARRCVVFCYDTCFMAFTQSIAYVPRMNAGGSDNINPCGAREWRKRGGRWRCRQW